MSTNTSLIQRLKDAKQLPMELQAPILATYAPELGSLDVLRNIHDAVLFWQYVVPDDWDLQINLRRKSAYGWRPSIPREEPEIIRSWSITPAAAITLNAMQVHAYLNNVVQVAA